jgi:predicted transcriptional regulator
MVGPSCFYPNLHKLQQKLLKYIHSSPGIRYRELLRLTDSSNGVLSYHLADLEGQNLITVERKKSVTRYYPPYITTEVSKIIGAIRNPISRQIISLLLKNNGCTFSELTISIRKAPSTVSWHLQRLIDGGIVKKSNGGASDCRHYSSRYYHVLDKITIEYILSKYVESPVDKIVSDYSDLMDELT